MGIELKEHLIDQAILYLKNKILHTPIEFSSKLTEILETPTFLKVESMQLTGSFKVRGALFYIDSLSENEKKNGVAACSAGNHGLGVAYASQKANIKCVIYVPKSVDQAKHEKLLKLNATVIRSEFDGYDETLEWTKNEVKKSGLHFISAFEDDRIMAANGSTIADEILKDIPDVKNIILPVGGGGIMAGMAAYFKYKNPSVRLIGCQHIDSPALKLSLITGEAVTTLPFVETIAGGIEGGIGKRCFEILKNHVQDVVLVSEREIEEGVRWILKNHQLLIEPSAVVGVSGCISKKMPLLKGKTVILLSGRNVAYETIKNVICE